MDAQKLTIRKRIYERVDMLINNITSGDYKTHFKEQMADFVACPWSEGQGGDLDG
jgi:hypothetical protein